MKPANGVCICFLLVVCSGPSVQAYKFVEQESACVFAV